MLRTLEVPALQINAAFLKFYYMAASKTEVTLQFPSFYTLWTFLRSARLRFYELDYRACILHGECSEEDISLAVIRYGATLIPDQGARIGRVHL